MRLMNWLDLQPQSKYMWVIWYLIAVLALRQMINSLRDQTDMAYSEGYDKGWQAADLADRFTETKSTSSDNPSLEASPTSSPTQTDFIERLQMKAYAQDSEQKHTAVAAISTTLSIPYLRLEVGSSETPANTASQNTIPNNDETNVNDGRASRKLILTFHSNGGLGFETEAQIGMFDLWVASKFLEHKGNELYTAQMIQQLQTQQAQQQQKPHGLQIVKNMPKGLKRGRN